MGLANPKVGVIGWCDTLVVPKDVNEVHNEAAHAMMDFLLDESYGVKLARGGPYAQSTSSQRDHLTTEERERIFIEEQRNLVIAVLAAPILVYVLLFCSVPSGVLFTYSFFTCSAAGA